MNERTFALYLYTDPNYNEVTGDSEPIVKACASRKESMRFVKTGEGVQNEIRLAICDGQICLVRKRYDEEVGDYVDHYTTLREVGV